ncbi:hypothetical protein Nepgr_008675 [Nepenthes gracilis]|uniref:Uncharacterized protein n=1 Tax=Nepenthes gracilis TaxID=150966 RepID=A0AAD3S9H5_NEPGR|nr:hypothetical protein Nepgr_008675 [Nepenthes gracilis]
MPFSIQLSLRPNSPSRCWPRFLQILALLKVKIAPPFVGSMTGSVSFLASSPSLSVATRSLLLGFCSSMSISLNGRAPTSIEPVPHDSSSISGDDKGACSSLGPNGSDARISSPPWAG